MEIPDMNLEVLYGKILLLLILRYLCRVSTSCAFVKGVWITLQGVKTMSTKEVSAIPVVVPVEAPASQHDLEDQSRALNATHNVLHQEALPRHRSRCTNSTDSIASIRGIGTRCHSTVSLN